jgi:hypothetical protein
LAYDAGPEQSFGTVPMAYDADIEHYMRRFYDSLSEKDKRSYAAVEAAKLGYGGLGYIANVLCCDPKTIQQGRQDLDNPPELGVGKVRRAGGGRKKTHPAGKRA